MTKKEINIAVKQALKTGNWMLRRSNNGRSYNGFQWNDIGKWTEAPDWNERAECGGGLHGNYYSLKGSGYLPPNQNLDFCETDGKHIVIKNDRIKCQKARVLLRNELPDIKMWNGSLYLDEGVFRKKIILPRKINGNLTLENCTFLKEIIFPLKIEGTLYLENCSFLKEIILPQVNNDLYFMDCLFLEKIITSANLGGTLYIERSIFKEPVAFPSGVAIVPLASRGGGGL